MKGGSPQGTRIGNLLFVITIEAIEERGGTLAGYIPPAIGEARDETRPGAERKKRFATAPIDRFKSNEFAMCSTPVKDGTMDGVLCYMDESGRRRDDTIETEPELPSSWVKHDPWTDKYIDDANVGQHHHVGQAPGLISVNKEKRNLRASECEEIFSVIKKNAALIGMRVNDAKLNLYVYLRMRPLMCTPSWTWTAYG